jgi:DNA-binding CsgD family transcriptional regulator
MAASVIGREGELGSLREFLEQIRHGPAALVLAGEPGIGKTILWEEGVAEAGRFGRVLSCRAVEAEASLAFAGLSELVAAAFDEVAPALPPLRRNALEVALLLAAPAGRAPDAHGIGLALLDVLHVLAECSPVVVAVDDAHWLDPSSAAVLQIALRRLRDEQVGVLTATRTSLDASLPFDLGRAFPEERLRHLSLGPPDVETIRVLLRERLSLELTRPELKRVQDATAGNPFFALEIGRELVRTGERPSAGRALRLTDSLQDLLGGRFARLPAEASDVLLLAAAQGRPTIDVVVAAYGEREAVQTALELAARERVITLDGSRVRFAHPLLASVCYERAAPWDRRAAHRALAGAVSDAEEHARHLALAADGRDTAVAAELELAAERAAARGATAAAAELFELAVELTPADEAEDSRRRRLQAVRFSLVSGRGEDSGAVLEQLLDEAPPGVERADVLAWLAYWTSRTDLPKVVELLEEALAEAEADDSRRVGILGSLAGWRLALAEVDDALEAGRAAVEAAERTEDPEALAGAIAQLGLIELMALEITPGLLERGAAIERQLAQSLSFFKSPSAMLGTFLTWRDELDRARAVLEGEEMRATARGDENSRLLLHFQLVLIEWLAGRWQRAREHATVARELAEQSQEHRLRGWVGYAESLVDAHLGRVEEAQRKAESALAISEQIADAAFVIQDLAVLGHLQLALGNLEAAIDYLRELPGRLIALGWEDPSNELWPDTIETLVALGELDDARAYLEQYKERARRASRLSRACAARCRGLLAASEGDLDGAFAAFERALAEHEGLSVPFERGRTLLALGTVRRQAKQKRFAREALEQALAIFESLGARLWAEKAEAELRRISGRRPASAELTETEERVARLAAEGRPNKTIAAELFMSVHTVEAHLSRVYRKLGIHSRGELAGRLLVAAEAAPK